MANLVRRQLTKSTIIKYIRSQGQHFGYGGTEDRIANAAKTVIVEYSSPNIAKPFHAGHLRSTVIGNYIANIYENLGYRVVRLNYLGDWGTQFGLLAVGFQRFGSTEALQSDPLQHLFQVYVKINQKVKSEKKMGSEKTLKEGLKVFKQMEEGDPVSLALWNDFRDISLKEYAKIYERLGIKFTEYHSESMYDKASKSLIDSLKQEGVIEMQSDGRGSIKIEQPDGSLSLVHVVKSDGTSLYITRDVAALMDRKDKYNFDKIHYVVENGQHLHFKQLQEIMTKIPQWKYSLNEDLHIKFGRVEGMSTREGKVVFLRDILDEAKNRMLKSLLSHKTTRVREDFEATADVLGCSAIILQDLAKKRINPFVFSWDNMLSFKGDSGVFLQYCHARLCSLEKNSELTMEDSCNLDHLLNNPNANTLLEHLTLFENAVQSAKLELESYPVASYLFKLCHLVNAAYKTCNLQHSEEEEAQAYLQMFHSSRVTLANGMRLLGLQPLDEM